VADHLRCLASACSAILTSNPLLVSAFWDRTLEELDTAWVKIKKATQDGLLGNSSKAATALPSPYAADPTKRVICVYTYDSDDREDVLRVRQALRDLGFDRPMPYKTDKATLEGRYQVKGHQRISLYYE
jgi:Basophilic leukemia-expressed protein Bles03